MGKKNLTKTDFQRQRLREFYDQLLPSTTKEAYLKFSQEIKLDVQQVYKWVWDKKNKSKIQERKKKEGEAKKNPRRLIQKIIYKNFVISVPRSKQGVSKFHSNESLWEETRESLAHEGWQLIRERPSNLPAIQYSESEPNSGQQEQLYPSESHENIEYVERQAPPKEARRINEPHTRENKVYVPNSDSLPSHLPQKGSSSGFHKSEEIYDSNQ